MKEFRSNHYIAQKVVCADRQHVYVENEDGYLFAQAIYPKKLRLKIYQNGMCTAGTTSVSDICPPRVPWI